jgi:transposase InsO family protein
VELHGNARLTPFQRELMCRRIVEEGWTVEEAADAAGCSTRTSYTWLARWRAGESMRDRSSAPKTVANRTADAVVAMIEELRRLRWTSTRIAAELRMAVSTVGAVLKRLGLQRLSRLEPLEPPNRYCRRHPGELIHIDVKKLGRFNRPGHRVTHSRNSAGYNARAHNLGWEFVHVAVDDTSRVAYLEILDDERGTTCAGFLERAIAFFARHGVAVERVMTDNGSGYRSSAHAQAIARLAIKHIRTRPYRPRTNGKAERFIQTMLRECAYAAAYENHQQRRTALQRWLVYYNRRRPHSALGHKPPISRLTTAA